MNEKFRNYKVVYRRYAGLFFCLCVDANDNKLAYLEAIHLFVEILGKGGLFYFIIYSFHLCQSSTIN